MYNFREIKYCLNEPDKHKQFKKYNLHLSFLNGTQNLTVEQFSNVNVMI